MSLIGKENEAKIARAAELAEVGFAEAQRHNAEVERLLTAILGELQRIRPLAQVVSWNSVAPTPSINSTLNLGGN